MKKLYIDFYKSVSPDYYEAWGNTDTKILEKNEIKLLKKPKYDDYYAFQIYEYELGEICYLTPMVYYGEKIALKQLEQKFEKKHWLVSSMLDDGVTIAFRCVNGTTQWSNDKAITVEEFFENKNGYLSLLEKLPVDSKNLDTIEVFQIDKNKLKETLMQLISQLLHHVSKQNDKLIKRKHY